MASTDLLSDQKFTSIAQSMRVSLLEIREREKESSTRRTVRSILVSGKAILCMEMGFTYSATERGMKGGSKWA